MRAAPFSLSGSRASAGKTGQRKITGERKGLCETQKNIIKKLNYGAISCFKVGPAETSNERLNAFLRLNAVLTIEKQFDVDWQTKDKIYDLAFEAGGDSGKLLNVTIFSKKAFFNFVSFVHFVVKSGIMNFHHEGHEEHEVEITPPPSPAP